MSIFYAILLGLLQGATEFLPISSSAHLALAEFYLGVDQAGLTFDVALHLGTLAGVLIYFRNDFIKMGMAFLAPDRLGGEAGLHRRLVGYIILGTIPAVIAGLLLEDAAESVFRDDLPGGRRGDAALRGSGQGTPAPGGRQSAPSDEREA